MFCFHLLLIQMVHKFWDYLHGLHIRNPEAELLHRLPGAIIPAVSDPILIYMVLLYNHRNISHNAQTDLQTSGQMTDEVFL